MIENAVSIIVSTCFWKSELIDFVFLQQDAFDETDALCPMDRQKFMLDLILDICDKQFSFADFEACRDWFKNLINLLRQMNYSPWQSEAFNSYREQISKLTEDNGE